MKTLTVDFMIIKVLSSQEGDKTTKTTGNT